MPCWTYSILLTFFLQQIRIKRRQHTITNLKRMTVNTHKHTHKGSLAKLQFCVHHTGYVYLTVVYTEIYLVLKEQKEGSCPNIALNINVNQCFFLLMKIKPLEMLLAVFLQLVMQQNNKISSVSSANKCVLDRLKIGQ